MFGFDGYLNRKQYAWAALHRLGLFAASVLGFPILIQALKSAVQCGHDTCAAVGLVGAMAFKPLAFTLFAISFAGVSMRRTRDAGVPGWIGLFIPLLLLGDYAFFIYSAAPWSFAFSAGQIGIPAPRFALLALSCIAVLCILPPRDGNGQNPFGHVGWLAFGLGMFVALFALLSFATYFPGLLVAPVGRGLYFGNQIISYAMAALFAALVWIVWQERGNGTIGSRPATEFTVHYRLPTLKLAAFAAAITLGAISLSITNSLSIPLVIAAQFTTIVLPTFLVYFCLSVALYLLLTKRTWNSVLIFSIAMLPIAHWAYAHWSTALDHMHEADQIAAISTMRAERVPATMVIDSAHVTATRAAWTIPGIQHVILRGAYGSHLMQFVRPRPNDRLQEPNEITSLPDEYLLLQIGGTSSFTKDRQMYAASGGPLELRLVDPSRNDLIAVWYRTYNPSPSLFPVLTGHGWFRGSNSASSDDINAVVADFLARALAAAS